MPLLRSRPGRLLETGKAAGNSGHHTTNSSACCEKAIAIPAGEINANNLRSADGQNLAHPKDAFEDKDLFVVSDAFEYLGGSEWRVSHDKMAFLGYFEHTQLANSRAQYHDLNVYMYLEETDTGVGQNRIQSEDAFIFARIGGRDVSDELPQLLAELKQEEARGTLTDQRKKEIFDAWKATLPERDGVEIFDTDDDRILVSEFGDEATAAEEQAMRQQIETYWSNIDQLHEAGESDVDLRDNAPDLIGLN